MIERILYYNKINDGFYCSNYNDYNLIYLIKNNYINLEGSSVYFRKIIIE